MLDISKLCERAAAAHFSDVKQVDDSIIRFTKKAGELPFAVYYFDLAQDLPETPERLTKYQDRVIGRHYFEGNKSLQWNNYLYFVTSNYRLATGEMSRAKELIESDRRYARKFVISEEDVDLVLAPHIATPTDVTPHAGILSIWTDCLIKAGLDKAILSEDDLPTRLKLVEASARGLASMPKARKHQVQVKRSPFMLSLYLKKFRHFPLQRSYTFGTVNLIFGANGSGKTSLLEAIELFYCGRNKRNPDTPPTYELAAMLADGQSKTATDRRRPQEFRDNNLTWYGVSEVKTTKLYQSFAQFNFLDTDAAVSLTESTSRIDDDLARLLVGPDASKTWRNIERVCEALSSKIHDIRPLKKQIEDELAVLERQIKEAAGIQRESDLIRGRLEEMIQRVGWRCSQGDKEEFAGKLVEALSELASLTQQAMGLDWMESPVSIEGLVKYCRKAKAAIEKAEGDIARLEPLERDQMSLGDAVKRDREALDLAQQIKRLIDADLPHRVAEQNKQQAIVATYSGWLAGIDLDDLKVFSTCDLSTNLADFQKATVSARTTAEAALARAKTDYTEFCKRRDQSLNLVQELRQLAGEIMQNSRKPDECPLCHTQFGSGELFKHINVSVDEHFEAIGQQLHNRLREQEGLVRDSTMARTVSSWLMKFCERANLGAGISIRSTLAKVEDSKRILGEARGLLDGLNSEILALESQGLSLERLDEIAIRLRELGYPFAEASHEAMDRLTLAVKQSSASSLQTLEDESKKAKELRKTIAATLGSPEDSTTGPLRQHKLYRYLSRLKDRLAATEHLRTKLDGFASSFPWAGGKPLVELAIEAESIRKVAAELTDTLGRERQADVTFAKSIQRKDHLQGRLAELRMRMKRLTEAHSTLANLQREHSLKNAMDSALQQNRASIEIIFSRIHAPAEFRGLGSSLTTLVRKVDDIEAKLSEISTGQRAAFALSIFLAQNAQITVAPPVILIDDPIAHVDDMNSLSFLDYLRDVALMGQRQIFFATANNKLARLFERKFDFLGTKDFRRFDLRRETLSVASSE